MNTYEYEGLDCIILKDYGNGVCMIGSAEEDGGESWFKDLVLITELNCTKEDNLLQMPPEIQSVIPRAK